MKEQEIPYGPIRRAGWKLPSLLEETVYSMEEDEIFFENETSYRIFLRVTKADLHDAVVRTTVDGSDDAAEAAAWLLSVPNDLRLFCIMKENDAGQVWTAFYQTFDEASAVWADLVKQSEETD